MEYHLYLRPVTEQDLEIIHSWNLNPLILKQFDLPDSKPNSWSDTLAWWRGLGSSLVFVVNVTHDVPSATYWRGRPIGLVWVKNIRENPEVGGYIGDTDYYKSNALLEMYRLAVEVVNRRTGRPTAFLKVKREDMPLIEALQQYGWCIDNETNGVVELSYGVTINNMR
jgi:hypothetical protein